ncbi:class F sortase [Rhodococcus sp. IEGM 1401]|uniref:class F sortase n=1 Tax=unclassified Rhodococcus (in: high G+C Gram-positive bacteria) TaxID=192944 RepID=UPI0022B4B486|nr:MULTISPECIES: class F sortase [unclassified Rhodococcus (in: high G+C Gram-positive bacteria)]MCZ4563947.1 class F sortase [Rhodococcus sp. IEGM 1401]MDI9924069.1 class F sortase [Rhodococcus sp. IEGM 1372]MDI9927888.1 class F sortase [Rhodococcus sp. IEGM 1341]MDV8036536.1 class F sortase [Rhodococcus sp. IEGM 1414]
MQSQITVAAPASDVAPAQPEYIELRSSDGTTYLSSPIHPDPLYRGGDSGQVLNPVDELPAWWAESGMPGTSTEQTVVVAGHNYSKRDAPFKALRVVMPGDTVALRTASGTLEYAVESVGPLPKGSLLADNELRRSVPGRLILANCDVQGGEPTDDNFVVVAQLVR